MGKKNDAPKTFRLSEFAQAGDFTPMADLEGKELMLHSTEFPVETKFGPAWKLNLVETDEEGGQITHTVITSAMVISNALEALESAVEDGQASYPVQVKFVKPGKAWLIE